MPIRLPARTSESCLERTVRRLPEAEQLEGAQSALPTTPAETVQGAPFLSLREAAEWLCVSLSTLKRMVASGKLETVRIGQRQKIPASVLEAYVARDILIPNQDMQLVDNDMNCTGLSIHSPAIRREP